MIVRHVMTLICLVLVGGCANFKTNLQHITNVNMQDHKAFHQNESAQDLYNQRVSTVDAGAASRCRFLSEIIAKDNLMDVGAKYAVLYVKVKSYEIGANAVVIDQVRSIGDAGFEAKGKAYDCPKASPQ